MGKIHAKMSPKAQEPLESFTLFFQGLKAAGKSTLVWRMNVLAPGERMKLPLQNLEPGMGINIASMERDNIGLVAWDTGNRDPMRPVTRNALRGIDGVVWVIDSADEELLDDVRKEIFSQIGKEVIDVPILFLANKEDLPNTVSTETLTAKLELSKLTETNPWHIIACSAESGQGLYEGLDWIKDSILGQKAMGKLPEVYKKEVIQNAEVPVIKKAHGVWENAQRSLQKMRACIWGKPEKEAN